MRTSAIVIAAVVVFQATTTLASGPAEQANLDALFARAQRLLGAISEQPTGGPPVSTRGALTPSASGATVDGSGQLGALPFALSDQIRRPAGRTNPTCEYKLAEIRDHIHRIEMRLPEIERQLVDANESFELGRIASLDEKNILKCAPPLKARLSRLREQIEAIALDEDIRLAEELSICGDVKIKLVDRDFGEAQSAGDASKALRLSRILREAQQMASATVVVSQHLESYKGKKARLTTGTDQLVSGCDEKDEGGVNDY